MDFTCFQSLTQIFNPQLNVNGTIECAIRGVSLVVRPEELVRQSLLHFLISQYNVLPAEKIHIKVECESMDIAIYMKPLNSNFSPDLPPILIIETKNKYVHPLDSDTNERQIKNYLKLKGCGVGILFNCDSGFIYEFSNESFSKANLVDLCDIIIMIKRECGKQEEIISEQYTDFQFARQGDFESFKRLIEWYGKNANSTIRFVYEQNKLPVRVAAFLFKIEGDVIYFRNRGLYTRKRESVSIRDFRQLLSIERLA